MNERRQVLRTAPAILLALCVAATAALWGTNRAAQADGAVDLGGPQAAYSQSFDTLASKGSSAALPLGWSLKETGSTATADGRYRAFTPGAVPATLTASAQGAAASVPLAALRSDDLVPLFGVKFTNNTGATIDALAIGYTGEQWRLGAAQPWA